jgi:molecular chaperone IbpA
MRTYDLSPLFRSSVGFDRMTRMLESALKVDDAALSYPPYNIEKLSDDAYRITMAVAGFGSDPQPNDPLVNWGSTMMVNSDADIALWRV